MRQTKSWLYVASLLREVLGRFVALDQKLSLKMIAGNFYLMLTGITTDA